MGQEIYILDLIGTFTFAIYGTYFAIKKNLDIFGIFVSAFLSGLGGGTLREILLNKIPFYLYDINYIMAIILAILFTLSVYKRFNKIEMFALLFDSIGLVTFAFIGASVATEYNLGIFAIIFFSVITAVGGSALRDIALDKTPKIMYGDLYASIAILLGMTYGVFQTSMQSPFWANILICFFLTIRLIAIFYKINLWKPKNILTKI